MSNESSQTRPQRNVGSIIAVDLVSSSLKAAVLIAAKRAGFANISDAFRTISRDFRADRIKYKDGVLQSPANSPN